MGAGGLDHGGLLVRHSFDFCCWLDDVELLKSFDGSTDHHAPRRYAFAGRFRVVWSRCRGENASADVSGVAYVGGVSFATEANLEE